MNVLVINQYAGNKGDRAIAFFVTRELRRNGVASVVMSTHDRRLWQDTPWLVENHVKLVPWGWNVECLQNSDGMTGRIQQGKSRCWRRFFPLVRRLVDSSTGRFWLPVLTDRRFLHALKNSDLVISTGGHHVTTLLSKDAVSEQLYDMGLVLIAGKPLVLWSQSIGPLDFVDSKNGRYVRKVLQQASRIYLRDRQSRDILQRMTVDGSSVCQTFESVIGLNDLCQEYTLPSNRPPHVGIAVYAAQARSAEGGARYIRAMASLVDHVVVKGLDVRFFPMELQGSGPDDRPLIHDILREVKHGAKVTVAPDMETAEHLREVAKCRVFIGHKTHSVIFALTVGTPLVAIAYHQKTHDFMRQYGLESLCVPDGELRIDDLAAKFDAVEERADQIGRAAFKRSREFGCTVRADFRELIDLCRVEWTMPYDQNLGVQKNRGHLHGDI